MKMILNVSGFASAAATRKARAGLRKHQPFATQHTDCDIEEGFDALTLSYIQDTEGLGTLRCRNVGWGVTLSVVSVYIFVRNGYSFWGGFARKSSMLASQRHLQ